jgi:hypothetical protein
VVITVGSGSANPGSSPGRTFLFRLCRVQLSEVFLVGVSVVCFFLLYVHWHQSPNTCPPPGGCCFVITSSFLKQSFLQSTYSSPNRNVVIAVFVLRIVIGSNCEC